MESTFKPYDGTDPYIFVSYARKDAETVLPVIRAAAGAGYRIWYDDAVEWTADWRDVIAQRVQDCGVFLAFHSEASLQSEHCDAEIKFALSEKRHILSVYLEEGIQDQLSPGLKMYLNVSQAVKLYEYADIDAFVERLTREKAFAPCKEPEWNKIGQIQWKLDAQGVLTIAMNEDLPVYYVTGSIPPYQHDPIHNGSTAPWMPYRDKIRSVVIRDDIYAIGDRAFYGCARLTSVTIGDSVTTIGNWAFYDCASLMSVTIGDSVTTIGNRAFFGCARLTSVTIGDSVTTIGERAFSSCTRLTSVIIGDGVTTIGNWAFFGCARLTSMTIPDSVTTIGKCAFYGCKDLTAIHVDKANRSYSSRDGILFDWEGTTLVRYPAGKVGKTYTIPDSVTTIGDWAFHQCAGLTSVTIPDSVIAIGEGAFNGCANLTKVEIPVGARFEEGGLWVSFPGHIQIIRRAPGGE